MVGEGVRAESWRRRSLAFESRVVDWGKGREGVRSWVRRVVSWRSAMVEDGCGGWELWELSMGGAFGGKGDGCWVGDVD